MRLSACAVLAEPHILRRLLCCCWTTRWENYVIWQQCRANWFCFHSQRGNCRAHDGWIEDDRCGCGGVETSEQWAITTQCELVNSAPSPQPWVFCHMMCPIFRHLVSCRLSSRRVVTGASASWTWPSTNEHSPSNHKMVLFSTTTSPFFWLNGPQENDHCASVQWY